MFIPVRRVIAFFAYFCAGIHSSFALSDDIEIYSGTESVSGTVAPNVVLLLDTSGSMGSNDVITSTTTVLKAAEAYDSTKLYTIPGGVDKEGAANTCADTHLYNSSSLSDDPMDSSGCNGSNRFLTSLFHCQAAVADLNSQGYWIGTLNHFRPPADNDWVSFSNNRNELSGSYKECREDDGLHGKAGATANFTGADNLQLQVPDMAIGDTKTRVSTSSNALAPNEWVVAGDANEPDATFLASSSEWTAQTVYHPNYLRYLYGWTDVNGNGSYDSGEGYNEEYAETTTTNHGTRLDVLKAVMLDLLDTWTGVNVGIMRYNVQSGSRVLYPVSAIEDHRDALKTVISNLVAVDATPHSEALYEAFNYYRGGYVEFGEAHSNVSVSSSRRATNQSLYRSPVQYSCQANTIIHMTDGRPTRDGGTETSGDPVIHYTDTSGLAQITNDVDVAIQALPNFSSLGDASCSFDSTSTENDGISPDNCMDELAEYMADNRHDVDIIADDGTLLATVSAEPIRTYTIGFALDLPFLQDTAAKGNGRYFTATHAAELRQAFDDLVTEIKQTGTEVISPPGVAVEAFSRSMHLDHLYFNLFQPRESARFEGNLKRYELGLYNNELQILGENGQPAINGSGAFAEDARSFWSSTADGNAVSRGGAIEQFTTTRNVYTYLGDADLTLMSNRFHETNTSIGSGADQLDLAAAEVTERDDVIRWGRGIDAFDADLDGTTSDTLHSMGDPLHTRPTLVVYDANSADPTTPDMLVFTITNDGYLHAIDSHTGAEQWAFIPQEVWKNVNIARNNPSGVGAQKLYGLDGFITAWMNDANDDGVIGSGEWAHVYFGMRRGGRNYYALDVTDKNAPKFMWQISGGTDTDGNGSATADDDFYHLGQTWGQMQRAVLQIGSTATNVLIFTAGYDTGHDDDYTVTQPSAMGNDIYIVKEEDGSILWHAQMAGARINTANGGMDYAIPADPAVIDINNDGFHDRMYVIDIAGGLWRFDIQNGQSAGSGLVVGGKLASLSTSNSAQNRKFYNQPDVATIKNTSGQYVAISVGSGHRAHPLNQTITDTFFSIRDPYSHNNIGRQMTATTDFDANLIDTASLADVTSYDSTTVDDMRASVFAAGKHGWYMTLPTTGGMTGEKVLASSVTVDNEVIFTTYEPPSSIAADGCEIRIGTSRVYSVALADGMPTFDRDEDGEYTVADRHTEIEYQGIAPSVVVLFPMATQGRPIGLIGTQPVELKFNNKLRRTYWYSPDTDPAN